MATKTKQPTELGGRVRGRALPPDVDLPPAVAEANEAAYAAAVELDAAYADQAEAARDVKDAARADQAAAARAAEAGESSVEITAGAKRARLEAAQLRVQAGEQLLKRRGRALRDAIRNDPDYLTQRQEAFDAAREEVAQALRHLPELWLELQQARALYLPAKQITEAAWSGSPYETTLTADKLTARIEKAHTRRRQVGKLDLADFEELIGDLRFHLEASA